MKLNLQQFRDIFCFFQEMGREQEKSEHILIQMKNYDAEAQKQTREKQLQEFLYQQTLVYIYVKG